MVRIAQFSAVVITALALIPSGAHLAVLLNKIDMSQADYFTVQAIYRGWAILGLFWPLALVANGWLAFLVRSQSEPFWFAILAALCFVVMFVVFLIWTQPANQATDNWTTVPENWENLRSQWEYSHAANFLIVFVALCLTTASVTSWRPGR